MDTVRPSHGLLTRAALVLLGATIAACSSPTPPPAHTTDAPQSAALWGDMKPVVSVKELMKYMIDPVADNIFNAVGSTLTKHGTVDIEPKTDEDWDKIRIGAISLAEGGVSAQGPPAVRSAGRREQQHGTGRGRTVAGADHREGRTRSGGVERAHRGAAKRRRSKCSTSSRRRDVDELWDVGENLDKACEACHRSYWYPGEGAEFYQKLRRRLETLREQSSRGNTGAKPQKR